MAKRERIYLVFHWAGLVLGGVTLLIFAAGYVLPLVATLSQTLGITLVVAGVVALIQSNENLRGVKIVVCRAQPTAAGASCELEVVVRNHADHERVGLHVRTGWRVKPRATTWLPVLQAGETTTVRLQLPTTARGRFAVPQLWVTSIRPMGLCFAWKLFEPKAEYFVYPAPRGRPLEPVSTAGNGPDDAGSQDVTGHRAYNPGDMLSRMDWRVFARTGKLVVRTLEEGEGDEVLLNWADTRFLHDTESRLAQLSFWIDQCLVENRPFTLDLGDGRSDLNHTNPAACREALASFPP